MGSVRRCQSLAPCQAKAVSPRSQRDLPLAKSEAVGDIRRTFMKYLGKDKKCHAAAPGERSNNM